MITTRGWQRVAAVSSSLAAAVMVAACDAGSHAKGEMRFVTDEFVIRVSADSLPIHAMETIRYRVVVSDLKTGKPIEGGQGRIFATNKDKKTTANGLEPAGELGTYRSTLFLVTSGLWAMAIQFRRDSTQPLQKTTDWTQDVLAGAPIGTIETPQSDRLDPDSVRKADSARADSVKKADSAKKAPPAKTGKP